MFDILRRYGKYLGGIDYEKVQELLINEEERLRKVEEVLMRELSENEESKSRSVGKMTVLNNVVKLEKLRLQAKLEMLKKRERSLQEMLIELKMSPGVTLHEINKLVRELKRTRREIRKVKKLLKYLEDSSNQA
ncbi:MAG: hypothetical protein GXO26_02385 [Crenarchaeota archaeon]|nr:hypothetical protein [Thermoproteota archaeon]